MPDEPARSFSLPTQLPKLVGVLTVDFDRKGQTLLRDLLQTSTHIVEEKVEYYDWDGPFGHAIHFIVPPEVFMHIDLDRLSDLEATLLERLNKLNRVRNEYVYEVTIQVSEAPVIGQPMPPPPRDRDTDLWGDADFLRLFITHKADDKALAADIKTACLDLGIACFVAHEDIEPTAEWLSEIDRALRSMDALLALLTPGFHDSHWTDQELGIAIGRGVPVIAIKLDQDPYGFIGRYQAIAGANRTGAYLGREILTTFLQRIPPTQQRMQTALVTRFEQADSFNHANTLMRILLKLDTLPDCLIDRLEAAPKGNYEVRSAYHVQTHLPGLLDRLRQAAGAQDALREV